MKALFADISERTRQRKREVDAYRNDERRRVLALCDAVQIALAEGQRERADLLLQEMHAIVDSALARRRGVPTRVIA
ncbi:MAG TPA: hypothetical protein VKB91_03270 [Gemmatimonadaceae bacterium]|nr:hypothetical protein [Gemmatimonadaceae bacterium]